MTNRISRKHKRTTRKYKRRNGGGLSPLSPGSSNLQISKKKRKTQKNYLDIEEFPLRFIVSKKFTKFSVLQERARQEREKLQQEKEKQQAREGRVNFFLNNTKLGRDTSSIRKKKY